MDEQLEAVYVRAQIWHHIQSCRDRIVPTAGLHHPGRRGTH